jgi:hypothetical protein
VQTLDEPGRMRGTDGEVLVEGGEQRLALAHEAAHHGIDEPGGASEPERAGGVHREMHAHLGCAARMLDLVRGSDEQRAQCGREVVRGPRDDLRHGRCQPQVPAQRAERDGAHRGAVGTRVDLEQRDISGAPLVRDRADRLHRCGQGGRSGREPRAGVWPRA